MAPNISLQTITGSYDENDNLLASTLVDEVAASDTGASVLSFVLSADGEIPEAGVEVTVNSDIDLTNYFQRLGRTPFSPGGEVLEATYDDAGKATGFKFRLEEPYAVINLYTEADETTEEARQAKFSLEQGEGYTVNDNDVNSSTVTFYDKLADVPAATVTPEVSLSVDNAKLVESQGNATTLNFSLSEAPPPEGVLVYVASPESVLGEFDIFQADIKGGVFPAPNFGSSGFYFKITDQNASITLPAFADDEIEGVEGYSFELQSSPGYTVAANNAPVNITVADTPESQISVSLTAEPEVLIETQSTASIHTFELSAPPPEAGVTVSVAAPNLNEFNLKGISVEGGEIVDVRDDGFDLKLTSQTATISLPVVNDGATEKLERATFTLQSGEGYQVNPQLNRGIFEIVDTPDQAPPPSAIVEPNDIVSKAVDTKLGYNYTDASFRSSLDYDGDNVYEKADGTVTEIDASEDVDFYKVNLKAGDRLTANIDSNQINLNTPLELDSTLRVFDVAGNEVAIGDTVPAPGEEFQSVWDAYVDFKAPTDGTYYVGVSAWENFKYNPNQAGTGSGWDDRGFFGPPGEYVLNLSLNSDPTPIATPIPSSKGEGPTVSLQTIAGTFKTDNDAEDYSIISPNLVENVDNGASVLTLSLQAEGEIPDGGLEVYINSNIDINEWLATNAEYGNNNALTPFSPGGEVLGPIYDDTGRATGIRFRMDEPYALISLPVRRDDAEEAPEQAQFFLEAADGYVLSEQATPANVTLYDSLSQAPKPIVTPEVSFNISDTELVESEGTSTTLTFNLSEPPPADGVLVYVKSDSSSPIAQFNIFAAEVTGGVFPPNSNADVSGFYFKITDQTASITLPVFADDVVEGIESYNFTLEPSAGYTVNSAANSAELTIADDADSQIQVSLNAEPTYLVESESTNSVHTFSLSATPPEGGVSVAVNAPNLDEFNLDAVEVTGGEITGVTDTGFTLNISDKEAVVNLPVTTNGDTETVEEVSFTLAAGDNYQVNPEANTANFTIVNDPQLAPPTATETESNDTLAKAVKTELSPEKTYFATKGAISHDYDNNYVDASEDVDLYSFTVKAGDQVTIDVDSIEYTIGGIERPQRADTELRVFDAKGTEVAYNPEDSAPGEIFVSGRDPYLEFIAPEDGTYSVGVAQLGNTTYDPFTAGSGSGRIFPDFGINTGEYELAINLTPVA